MRKNRQQIAEEHRRILEWCLTVLDFRIERGDDPQSHITRRMKDSLKRAFDTGNFRGLKLAYGDTTAMIRDMTIHEQREIDNLLREKFGSGLDEVFAESDRKADKILRRGKIKSEEEFYFLREYFESIWEDDKHRERAALIDEMLAEFDKREE